MRAPLKKQKPTANHNLALSNLARLRCSWSITSIGSAVSRSPREQLACELLLFAFPGWGSALDTAGPIMPHGPSCAAGSLVCHHACACGGQRAAALISNHGALPVSTGWEGQTHLLCMVSTHGATTKNQRPLRPTVSTAPCVYPVGQYCVYTPYSCSGYGHGRTSACSIRPLPTHIHAHMTTQHATSLLESLPGSSFS